MCHEDGRRQEGLVRKRSFILSLFLRVTYTPRDPSKHTRDAQPRLTCDRLLITVSARSQSRDRNQNRDSAARSITRVERVLFNKRLRSFTDDRPRRDERVKNARAGGGIRQPSAGY